MGEKQEDAERTATQDAEPKTGEAEKIEALLKEHPDLQKYLQSEADRRVTQAIQKKEREFQQKLLEEKRRAQKEAEEAKMLEDGKLQELLERKSREAEEAKQALAKYEHMLKVDALLDKHEVEDKDMRRLLRKLGEGMDLKDLDAEVTSFNEKFSEAVTRAVDKRLAVTSPPKKTPDAPKTPLDRMERIKQLQAEGKMKEAKDLLFQISDERARLVGSAAYPSGFVPNFKPVG